MNVHRLQWIFSVSFFLFPSGPFVFQYEFDECARHSTALSELGLFALQKQLLFCHFLLQWLLLVNEINCKKFLPLFAHIHGVRGMKWKNKTKRFLNQRISLLNRAFFPVSSFCAYHVFCQRLNCINCDSLSRNNIPCSILKRIV